MSIQSNYDADNLKAFKGMFLDSCGGDYEDVWYGIWNEVLFRAKYKAYTPGRFISVYPQLSFPKHAPPLKATTPSSSPKVPRRVVRSDNELPVTPMKKEPRLKALGNYVTPKPKLEWNQAEKRRIPDFTLRRQIMTEDNPHPVPVLAIEIKPPVYDPSLWEKLSDSEMEDQDSDDEDIDDEDMDSDDEDIDEDEDDEDIDEDDHNMDDDDFMKDEIGTTESIINNTKPQAMEQMEYILSSNAEVRGGFKYLIVCGGYFKIYDVTITANNKPVFNTTHSGMHFLFDNENFEVAKGINSHLLSLIQEITNS